MKNKPNIIHLISGTLISLAKNSLFGESNPAKVTIIGNYQLKSSITKKYGFKNFFTGIYTYNNKKVFIKTWSGKVKDINYYLLMNEYIIGITLKNKLHSLQTNNRITFPQILDYHKTQNSFSIIYDFISGKPLSSYNKSKQAAVLFKSLQLLSEISGKLNKNEKENISKRSILFYYLSLPILTSCVLLSNRIHWKIIVISFLDSLKEIKSIKNTGLMLAHRDLNPNNILIYKKTAYILDCERVILTVPCYDIVHMLVARGNKHIKNSLLKQFNKSKYTVSTFLKNYICIHYIFSLQHAAKTKNYYINVLSKFHSL